MPDFDEALYRRRVRELIADGLPEEEARNEAWLEQHPEGDVILVDDDEDPAA